MCVCVRARTSCCRWVVPYLCGMIDTKQSGARRYGVWYRYRIGRITCVCTCVLVCSCVCVYCRVCSRSFVGVCPRGVFVLFYRAVRSVRVYLCVAFYSIQTNSEAEEESYHRATHTKLITFTQQRFVSLHHSNSAISREVCLERPYIYSGLGGHTFPFPKSSGTKRERSRSRSRFSRELDHGTKRELRVNVL